MTSRLKTAAAAIMFGISLFAPTASADEVVCHEDEPCWDCETMGNMQCGPIEPAYPPAAPEVPTAPMPVVPAPAATPIETTPTLTG